MFAKANPFDESVTAATDENLTSENWDLILNVCERISNNSPEAARDCVAAIQKRLGHRNANVQLYALALSDALVKNCNITVHHEISSRSFTNTLTKLIRDKGTHESVRQRTLELIQSWKFEFREDARLGLMNEVYHSLRADGIQFPSPSKPKKDFTQTEVDRQKEEEEFQLALALSLSESEDKIAPKAQIHTQASSQAQGSAGAVKPESRPSQSEDETPRVSRVRALYDFQPTEASELEFQKGDIIRVIESVYRDWWKGELRGNTGIFPVNYVEKIVDPTPAELLKEAQTEAEVMSEIRNVDHLLDLLERADTKDSFSDNDELQGLYNSTLAIRPKLVRLIEKYSLKKDELVALNDKFLKARTLYDTMLSSSIAKYTSPTATHGYPPPAHHGHYSGSESSPSAAHAPPTSYYAMPSSTLSHAPPPEQSYSPVPAPQTTGTMYPQTYYQEPSSYYGDQYAQQYQQPPPQQQQQPQQQPPPPPPQAQASHTAYNAPTTQQQPMY